MFRQHGRYSSKKNAPKPRRTPEKSTKRECQVLGIWCLARQRASGSFITRPWRHVCSYSAVRWRESLWPTQMHTWHSWQWVCKVFWTFLFYTWSVIDRNTQQHGCAVRWLVARRPPFSVAWVWFQAVDLIQVRKALRAFHILSELPSVLGWDVKPLT